MAKCPIGTPSTQTCWQYQHSLLLTLACRQSSAMARSSCVQGGPLWIEAMVSTLQGRWLELDSGGTVTWHGAKRTSVMGAIGPKAARPRPAQSAQNRSLLVSLSTDHVVASWPERAPDLLRGAATTKRRHAHCSGQKQIQVLTTGHLLLAHSTGELAE